MRNTNNVVFATTTNGNESKNGKSTNPQVKSVESVVNGEVHSASVADVEVQKLEGGKLYYGCSNNSMKKDRIVYVVMREHSRGVDMVEYEEWSRNVNGYDENGDAKYVWTMNRYRKSVKLSGNDESMVRTEYVDGPHGVSANHTITEDEMKRNSVLNCGLLEMSEEDYNTWKTTMNELNMRGGLRAYYTPAEAESMDEVDNTYVPSRNEEVETVIREKARIVCGSTFGVTFEIGRDKYGNQIMCDITRLDDGKKLITIYDVWRKNNTDNYDYEWKGFYDPNDVHVYADVAMDFLMRLINTKKQNTL